MSRSVIVLLLLAAVVAINAAPQAQAPGQCGANESFDSCGTECQPTCKTPNPGVCTLRCVPSCQCLHGYVRNDAGECVLTRNC